jgi:hypothetical protein
MNMSPSRYCGMGGSVVVVCHAGVSAGSRRGRRVGEQKAARKLNAARKAKVLSLLINHEFRWIRGEMGGPSLRGTQVGQPVKAEQSGATQARPRRPVGMTEHKGT